MTLSLVKGRPAWPAEFTPTRAGEAGMYLFSGVNRQGRALLRREASDEGLERGLEVDGVVLRMADLLARTPPIQRSWQIVERTATFRAQASGPRDTGRLLDRFEVQGVLGVGGMACVYRVVDAWDDQARTYALKVMHPGLSGDRRLEERIRREYKVVRGLSSNRLVPILQSGVLPDGRVWLQMPVLEGGTLEGQVKLGGCDPARVTLWAEEMLEALVVLERAGLVHRDVKPANFLLDAAHHVHLADFGIALAPGDTRLTGTVESVGTLAYMPPETRHSGISTTQSDVWSAATVLHELMTGARTDSPGEGVAGTLGALVRAMGAANPATRITASAALARLTAPPNPETEAGMDGASGAPVASDELAELRRVAANQAKEIARLDAASARLMSDAAQKQSGRFASPNIEPPATPLPGLSNPDGLEGRFSWVRQLHITGFAELHLVEQTSGGSAALLKVLLRGADSRLFADEAKLLSAIRSRAVRRVLDSGTWDGRPALVLDFVEGANLQDLMDRLGTLPPKVAVEACQQVANVLRVVHAQRGGGGEPLAVVHRDVKPKNVFLTPAGEDRWQTTPRWRTTPGGIAKPRPSGGGPSPRSPLPLLHSPHRPPDPHAPAPPRPAPPLRPHPRLPQQSRGHRHRRHAHRHGLRPRLRRPGR